MHYLRSWTRDLGLYEYHLKCCIDPEVWKQLQFDKLQIVALIHSWYIVNDLECSAIILIQKHFTIFLADLFLAKTLRYIVTELLHMIVIYSCDIIR